MKKKPILTTVLLCVLLYAPFSLFAQDFQMNGTVLVKYNGNAASVIIPAGVTSIGDSAFSRCSSLTSITIPAGVTSIGDLAFANSTSLNSITIPNSVTSIGDNAFYNTAWLNNQIDGLVYAGKVLYTYKGTMSANTVINNIRTDTIAIAKRAFDSSTGLTSISIPVGITIIGNGAFSYCTSLTSVTMPSSVTSIGVLAFFNCHSLTSINIPTSVTSIGAAAFNNCYSLTSLNIPASVTSIGDMVFLGLSDKTTINIEGHANQASADKAWGTEWRVSDARINYLGR